jgi:amino acid permease
MSIFMIIVLAACIFAAVYCSTRCVLHSDNRHNLPKEIADELDPYNKLTS